MYLVVKMTQKTENHSVKSSQIILQLLTIVQNLLLNIISTSPQLNLIKVTNKECEYNFNNVVENSMAQRAHEVMGWENQFSNICLTVSMCVCVFIKRTQNNGEIQVQIKGKIYHNI